MKLEDLTLDVEQQIDIKAPPEKVFPAVLERFGKKNTRPDGESLNLQIEAKPGGRWYRDRGNGIGHLWGFVQVIKPPKVLELAGPMMMSYPVASHIQYRLVEQPGGTLLKFTHQAFGLIQPGLEQDVSKGWGEMLEQIRAAAEKKRG